MKIIKKLISILFMAQICISAVAEEIKDLSLHVQSNIKDDGSLVYQDGNKRLYFSKTPFVDFGHVIEIKTISDKESERITIEVSLNEEGSRMNYKVTSRNVGRKLAVIVNGKIVSAPTIREPIKQRFQLSF